MERTYTAEFKSSGIVRRIDYNALALPANVMEHLSASDTTPIEISMAYDDAGVPVAVLRHYTPVSDDKMESARMRLIQIFEDKFPSLNLIVADDTGRKTIYPTQQMSDETVQYIVKELRTEPGLTHFDEKLFSGEGNKSYYGSPIRSEKAFLGAVIAVGFVTEVREAAPMIEMLAESLSVLY